MYTRRVKYEGEYRKLNHIFDRYREEGFMYNHFSQVPADPEEWLYRPFPNGENPDPRNYHPMGWFRQMVDRDFWKETGRRDINTSTITDGFKAPGDEEDQQNDGEAKHQDPIITTHFQAREYFSRRRTGMFIVGGKVGYSSDGLLHIKVLYRGDKLSDRLREYILKIDVTSYDSDRIRTEERAMRRVAGAAHCMQLLDRKEFGLPPSNRLITRDLLDKYDSSSGESSGSDTADETPPRPRLSRRVLLEHEPEMMELRRLRHQQRIVDMENNLEVRGDALFDQMQLNPAFDQNYPEHIDEFPKEYLLFESMQHGDLAHLICRLHDQRANAPNRVLWSFWLCLLKACLALE
ncbi:hypothetical protein F4804DRAFT_336151 [Jackrogersella minutella]|nr:hypothetical protein F4804DRAFT_336151 [Jackrogersella minutella]